MKIRWMAIACVFATLTLADTLTLRDGRTVDGNYAGGDTRTIRMMVGDSVQTFQVADVASLSFGAAPAASAATPAPAAATAAPAPAAQPPDDIPAGTEVTVRMIDPVNSETDQPGYTFRASLDEPVVVNGKIVCPKDSDVVVKLVEQKQSGKFTGKPSLTLALAQLQVNGTMMHVYSEKVTQTGASRGKKTAVMAGGGAALGAVIGAIAGGGSGAAIGAATGGAAGAGVQVFTSGEKVKIPSETRLTFTLASPVRQ